MRSPRRIAAIPGGRRGPPESAPSLLASLIGTLEPLVDELACRFAKPLGRTEARELDLWVAKYGGSRAPRLLATDAVLLALCEAMAGDRPEFSFLRTTRSRVTVSKETVETALAVCRNDDGLLGPLYESMTPRRDRHPLGQYFTPAPISRFMAEIVARAGAESVLDPAVGAGALLSGLPKNTRLRGTDVSPLCVALAAAGLSARGFTDTSLTCDDFLAAPRRGGDRPSYDAVICNPPYMRHHLLAKEEKRRLTARYGERFHVVLSTLSTNYVYFFLEALERLHPGGLLVFITSADFLDTRFGEGLRRALSTCATIEELLLFDRDRSAFEGAMTTSVITIARKDSPTSRHPVKFTEGALIGDRVLRGRPNRHSSRSLGGAGRWSVLFGDRAAELSRLTSGRPRALSDYLRVRRGIATGANDFFVLSQQVVDRWRIEPEYLQPVIASARDLPDGDLSLPHWEAIRARGRPCWLLSVEAPLDLLRGKNVHRYLEHGARSGVHRRFNCRTRTPWYRPENVPPPDIIITYMNRGPTRFVRNSARCRVMSVFLNGFLRSPATDVTALLAALNGPETSALIGTLGRTYGGGLGKVEPGELAALPMPALTKGAS